MKKNLFLVLFIVLLLTGCTEDTSQKKEEEKKDDTPVVIDECELFSLSENCLYDKDGNMIEDTFRFDSYASGVEVFVNKIDMRNTSKEDHFHVDITSVSYSPIEREICVFFSAYDEGFANANYFMILQDTQRHLTRQQIQLGSYGERFNNGDCMDVDDPTLNYRILIGKIDSDSYSYDPTTMDATVTVSVSDNYKNDRKAVQLHKFEDMTPEFFEMDEEATIKSKIQLSDNEEAITAVRVSLRSPNGITIFEEEIDPETVRVNGILNIIREFTNLLPYGEYEVRVVIDGNDGVDDFESLRIFEYEIKASTFERWKYLREGLLTSYHGLFAYVREMDLVEDDIVFDYYYKNDESVLDSNGNPRQLQLVIYDEESNFVSSYQLETGKNRITIPVDELDINYTYEIRDQETTDLYDYAYLPNFEPRVAIYSPSADSIEVRLFEDYGNIVGVNIKVYANGYGPVIEEYNMDDIYNNPYYTYYHDFGDIGKLVVVTIQYEAYGKIYEVTESENR